LANRGSRGSLPLALGEPPEAKSPPEGCYFFFKRINSKMNQQHLLSKITRHSKQIPGKTAIKYGEQSLTYADLEIEVNKIANFFLPKIKNLASQNVLIMLDRSPGLIISILGLVKCGLIVVPIDPGLPVNRLRTFFKETNAQWLITSMNSWKKIEQIPAVDLNILWLDENTLEEAGNNFTGENIYNKYCYIYFTSGSTGTPRGVLGRHRSLVHFIDWEIEEFAVNSDFNCSQLTNPSFDPFLRDIFVPLVVGATCCIPGDPGLLLNPPGLVQWIDQNRVHLIHMVPSLFKALCQWLNNPDCLSHVKYILLAGELLRGNDIKKFTGLFGQRIQLVNLYGPTETTLAKLFYRIQMSDVNKAIIPVGIPITDTQVMVLDDCLQPCPLYNAGEVYIRTPFISSGYFNDRALTRKVFIKNPFSDNPRDIIYKTGDSGRIGTDGNLELLGRLDSQVKIRGVRVEPGEIEDLLLNLDDFNDAVVLAPEDENGDKHLIAYFTARREFTVNELREYLAKYLPVNMIPSYFMRLEKMPLNTNGKIDRLALLQLKHSDYNLNTGTAFAAPRTETEQIIADIWKGILKLDQVGINDNFFDLGGNSMHLIQVNDQLKKALNRNIPVVELLAYPTVNLLSRRLLENEKKQDRVGMEKKPKALDYPVGPAAVIGMAGRFPGADHIEGFWDNLKNGIDSISFFSPGELEEIEIPSYIPEDPDYIKAKGFLENIEFFDANFFDYSSREAELMDPQLRFLHEGVWHALENAGYTPGNYSGWIGLFIGAAANFSWISRFFSRSGHRSPVEGFDLYTLNSIHSYATRVSYKLNLKGPGISLQTACSTGLVSIHLAYRALLNNECDLALAGAVCISLPTKSGYLYQEGMIYSADGHCRAFSADACGTVFGDGMGIVVLKRLKEAMADGDTIYAVIRGSAVNNDGYRKVGYTAPGVEGQAAVITKALVAAGLGPRDISYIETHGTGTLLGDPAEIQALIHAFNINEKGTIAIGSVKTNVGHLGAAAGAAGFIKTVLALKHQLIPPSLYFDSPNPNIDFHNSPFFVNTRLIPWKSNRSPLRAGVSSFGIGGTNAHVILEEAPAEIPGKQETIIHDAGPHRSIKSFCGGPGGGFLEKSPMAAGGKRVEQFQLILLSAKTPTALEKMTDNLRVYLKDKLACTPIDKNMDKNHGLSPHDVSQLADTAFTLQVGREAFEHRRMLVCTTTASAVEILAGAHHTELYTSTPGKNKSKPFIVFMFPGLGSQYVNMGLGLYQTIPRFRREMDRGFDILRPLLGYDVKEVLFPGDPLMKNKDAGNSIKKPVSPVPLGIEHQPGAGAIGTRSGQVNLDDFEIAQVVMIIFEYSLARVLIEWGIKPDALIGYSFGEYAAALVSGLFSPEDALKVVVYRGGLVRETRAGAMLSVPLTSRELVPLVKNYGGQLAIAIDNGSSCVVSGVPAAVKSLEKQVRQQRMLCMPVPAGYALHSSLMEPVLEKFKAGFKDITFHKPQVPFVSNVTGKIIDPVSAADPGYWCAHLRQTVRFAAGLEELQALAGSSPLFIEVGPGHELSGLLARQMGKDRRQPVLDLVRQPERQVPDDRFLMNKLGLLWLKGVDIDWVQFHRDSKQKRRRVPLPVYPFEGKYYWTKSLEMAAVRAEPSRQKKKDISDWFYFPQWERSQLLPADSVLISPASRVMVLSDSTGLGSRLACRLQPEHKNLILVSRGEEFRQTGEYHFVINPDQESHYHCLMQSIGKHGQIPVVIIYLWTIEGHARGENILKEGDADTGLTGLLYLARALVKQEFPGDLRIQIVTGGLYELTGEERLCPWQGALVGLAKVIPQEYPHIKCRCIDIEVPPPHSDKERKLLDHLALEVNTFSINPVIAYRWNQRWVQIFKPVRLQGNPDEVSPPRLRRRGVYFISGGLGNIGFTLADYLSRSLKAKLVLTGLSPLPPRDRWDKYLASGKASGAGDNIDGTALKIRQIKELEAQGAEVLFFNCDAAEQEQVQEIARRAQERFGSVHGVIHAAAAPYRRLVKSLDDIDINDFQRQLAPKVKGLIALENVFQDQALDFRILISSPSSILGGLGFAAYAAANSFSDALVYRLNRTRGRKGSPWITVNWGDWLFENTRDKDNQGPLKDALHYLLMTPNQGITTFQRILSHCTGTVSQVVVSAADLHERVNRWVTFTARENPITGPGDENKDKSTTPYQARPVLMTAYTPPVSRMEKLLSGLWQNYFGLEKVGIHDNFFELGATSLDIVHLGQKVKEATGRHVQVGTFFRFPNIRELALHLSRDPSDTGPGARGKSRADKMKSKKIPHLSREGTRRNANKKR
jgi:polyketide synthase PksJ